MATRDLRPAAARRGSPWAHESASRRAARRAASLAIEHAGRFLDTRTLYSRNVPERRPRRSADHARQLLHERDEDYDLVLIGGGALLLLGLIERPTKDLDAVARVQDGRWLRAEPLPEGLLRAVAEVADALDLEHDWLNPGPAGLVDLGLPGGFADRAVLRHYESLTVRLAAVEDLIAFKLYAAADHWPDRSRHLADLRQLGPTPEALVAAARWCRTHDPSDGFRDMLLLPVLAELGVVDSDV